ncbi:hypothetical protein GN956_G23041 [Arapaima gigas]
MYRTENLPHHDGRGKVSTPEQQQATLAVVKANNVMRLLEIQDAVKEDYVMFSNINTASLVTTGKILKRKQIYMRQDYRVPSESNSEWIKGHRQDYVWLKFYRNLILL